jgi:hypothetical protein
MIIVAQEGRTNREEKEKERESATKSEREEGEEGERESSRDKPEKVCVAVGTTSLQFEGELDGEVTEANLGACVDVIGEIVHSGGVEFDL